MTTLTVRTRLEPEWAVLAVSGDLSLRSVPQLRTAIYKALVDHGRVIVDVAAVKLRARSAVLLFPAIQAKAGGWPWVRLVLAGADPRFRAAVVASRVDAYVPSCEDPTEASLLLGRRPPRVRQRREFEAVVVAPRLTRRFVAETCIAWELSDELTEKAVLVASELVANAVDHAGTAATVTVELDGGALRVAVRDGCGDRLVARDPGPADPRGRGVLLMDRLAVEWGVRDHVDGKTVWALLSPDAVRKPSRGFRTQQFWR
jgi:anti-sigma regulatory factor (Ser/Thr protein kinase)